MERQRTQNGPNNPEKGNKQKAGAKGRRRRKEQTLYSVGEEEGGMTWENRTETYASPYVKWEPVGVWRVTPGTHSRWSAAAWRDGVGREVAGCPGGRGHMHAHGWFMLMYGENHHNTVIILQLKKKTKQKSCCYPQLQFIPTQFDSQSVPKSIPTPD